MKLSYTNDRAALINLVENSMIPHSPASIGLIYEPMSTDNNVTNVQ